MMRTHLQTILAKSVDKQSPPERDIAHFWLEIKDGIPVSAIYDQTIASALCWTVIGDANDLDLEYW